MAGQDLNRDLCGGEDGAHPLVGLDGDHVGNSFGEQPREDARPCPDFEDIGRALGNQPVERFVRWTGAEPVVLVRNLSERPAQDGAVLVLAHGRKSSEMVRPVNSGPVPGWWEALNHQLEAVPPPSFAWSLPR